MSTYHGRASYRLFRSEEESVTRYAPLKILIDFLKKL
jgi:hypothetical protein